MKVREARVPLALLKDRTLSASAKLVWAVLHLEATAKAAEKLSIAHVARQTGLSKRTVRTALSQLSRSGWQPATGSSRTPMPDPGTRGGSRKGPTVRIPADLLFDRAVRPRARLMYGLIQAVPGFRHPSGESTYLKIGRLAGKDPRTVKTAIHHLVSAGWLEFSQVNQCAPVRFTLRNPVVEKRERELALVRRRIERAEFLGEALMREYLSLIVDSEEFEDDAAPGYLVNPLTNERLQFDRYYPPNVAFEFNGPQHYRATERFSAEEAAKQRARDLIKRGICVEKGIRLVVVHAEDLTLETMLRKVEGCLPIRRLTGHEELINYLEQVSRPYRRSARRREHGAAGSSTYH